MISINVKIHRVFKKILPPNSTGKVFEVRLDRETEVRQALRQHIGFPPGIPKLMFVNGIHAEEQTVLKDGDRLSIFTPMTGG
jgi:sulfur-carrier protein